jgi:hypothetical protein
MNYLTLYLVFIVSLYAIDEYPTLINPDGSFQFKEFNEGQKKSLEFMKSQNKYFLDEIQKFIPYLIKIKSFKENTFTREFRNYIEQIPNSKKKYFVRDTFSIKINSGKIQSIEFSRTKSLLNPEYNPETVIKTIQNSFETENLDSLSLSVETKADHIDKEKPEIKKFSFKETISPIDRIKILRAYRNKLEETLRELDKLVDFKALQNHTNISNTLKEIEID